jgi:hypothetical protein
MGQPGVCQPGRPVAVGPDAGDAHRPLMPRGFGRGLTSASTCRAAPSGERAMRMVRPLRSERNAHDC